MTSGSGGGVRGGGKCTNANRHRGCSFNIPSPELSLPRRAGGALRAMGDAHDVLLQRGGIDLQWLQQYRIQNRLDARES